MHWPHGEPTADAEPVVAASAHTGNFIAAERTPDTRHAPLLSPTHISEECAEFLGYLIGAGHSHRSQAAIGYTAGDRAMAERYTTLVRRLFAIEATRFGDAKAVSGTGSRWHVVFYSTEALALLHAIGVDLDAQARQKRIPDVILRSPKSVVSAFLRAYCDCEGHASVKQGVILATMSEDFAHTLQILLLNYGILSRKRSHAVHITGRSAELFAAEIGFGLARNQEQLRAYLASHRWFRAEKPYDVVTRIEHGMADVYDITVEHTHRYVANGMLHHNSLWHARIIRQLDLSDGEAADFAQMHAGVLAPSRMRINPYHLGYKVLEDIERRWDNPTEEERVKLGRQPGQGRKKLFEVRETDNDISLLRNYLTKDLVEDLDLYLYHKEGDEWVISEKNWEKVRDGVVASMTNFGQPYITVYDADLNGNTELLLTHHHEGQDLDLVYTEKTLEYLYYIWSRPVHLDTVLEEQPVRFSYNGDKHARTDLDADG
jgi:stage V sporulation protein R